jgi:hypothetical protein
MAHPIVEKILREGVASIKTDGLSPALKRQLFSEAGAAFMHANRPSDAASAFNVAGNTDALREHGDWLRSQQRIADAVHFLVHVETDQKLSELAQTCVGIGDIAAARMIYTKLGDTTMLTFLDENFNTQLKRQV